MAQRFVEEGAKVAILDINYESAKFLSVNLGKSTIAINCDVTKSEEVDKAVKLL